MFVDEALITVKGGRGGAGKVAFFANKSGPSGGNGGNGGDVYAIATSNLTHLKSFLSVPKYSAESGSAGGSNKRWGEHGHDLEIKVPLGTTFIDLKTKEEVTVDKNNPQILLCKGGRGGRGNLEFKSSTNRTPRNCEPGNEGEARNFKLILKLIANFGLIGLPNAGKSSLLNALTAANVRTANYPFTTLEPNLGVYEGKVLADVPGLIEGASSGKGLGIKFLKHIEKVDLIFHCISVESENSEAEYQTVIKELSQFNKKLLDKKSLILLTKIDLVDENVVDKKIEVLKKLNSKILPISIYKPESLKKLKTIISM
ncbi:MAG: GTPase obg [Candidatus Roizmanbacteria bacterium GW2011_GWA2_35_19]|uniref:GTPase obg n=2 Tax=Candidatus Roizmaniibacteriota TaxID=1752723 RepID=A0A0G0EAX3_9BACT|nr:MAG: GTPase obg [Candidatus Roizmanbacteria bacterium GW2011_GWC2_35_12]KKP72400.1 MAG: GTPase obg [Candidatus Roizmanbacteria bacterium GW2011_GWA2_35_19]